MDEHPVLRVPTDEVIEEEEFERLYAAPVGIIALLSLFYGSISVVAIVGNTLVIWVVFTTRQMHTVTNMYIANLAVADVIIGLFSIPFQFQAALLQRWNLPEFMCGFCPFVQCLSVNVSVFTLTAIAVDRHRAIINPLRARPSKYISKFVIANIWLFSLLFGLPCAYAFRVQVINDVIKEEDGFVHNETRPFCLNYNLSEDQLLMYRYFLVVVQYVVPFCVISFVYIQMAVKLWGTQTPGNAQDTRDLTLLKNKKKVIKMLIIVVVVFGLCWLPLQLYNVLYVTLPEINEYHFISIVWFTCDWLAMSNSCYNPFIYGIYNEKFKREFKKRFAKFLCKSRRPLFDMSDRTLSMHTRASSVRSMYFNTSMRCRGVRNVNNVVVTSVLGHNNNTNASIGSNTLPHDIISYSATDRNSLQVQQERRQLLKLHLPVNDCEVHPRKWHASRRRSDTSQMQTFELIATYTGKRSKYGSQHNVTQSATMMTTEPTKAATNLAPISGHEGPVAGWQQWENSPHDSVRPLILKTENDVLDCTAEAHLKTANLSHW